MALGLLGGAFPRALGCGRSLLGSAFPRLWAAARSLLGSPSPGPLAAAHGLLGGAFPGALGCGPRPPGQQVPWSSPQPGSGAASTRHPPVGGRERVLSGRASGAFQPAVVSRSPTWPPSPGEKRRKEESANRHSEGLCRTPAPGPRRGPRLSRGASLEDPVLHSIHPVSARESPPWCCQVRSGADPSGSALRSQTLASCLPSMVPPALGPRSGSKQRMWALHLVISRQGGEVPLNSRCCS